MASSSFQLVMRLGPTPGKLIPLNSNEVGLGRDIVNEIIVNDPEISRKHARFVRVGGGYQLEDLGSTNGTYVNGQRLMGPHQLESGELIMFGENVGMVYERVSFDPDATLVSAAEAEVTPTPPRPMPAYSPIPPPASFKEFPFESAEDVEPEGRRLSPWAMAGLGCLLIGLCVIVVGAIVFDAMNLYCIGPFRAITVALGLACP
jgi:predicted component of type VI protein secretion system